MRRFLETVFAALLALAFMMAVAVKDDLMRRELHDFEAPYGLEVSSKTPLFDSESERVLTGQNAASSVEQGKPGSELRKRFAFPFSSQPDVLFDYRGAKGLDYSMVSPVKGILGDSTTITIVTEEISACLGVLTVPECMSRLGSYGIRRLHSYGYFHVLKRGWERPDWMSHPAVQGKRLMNLVLPMTHCSGCYEMFLGNLRELGQGVSANYVKQDYDVFLQAMLGVRSFDIGVAVNTLVQRLYVAEAEVMVSLERVLDDIKMFLDMYTYEVVVLDMRIAPLVVSSMYGTTGPLRHNASIDEIPGAAVHAVVKSVLGKYLALHGKWTSCLTSFGHSPRVGDLVGAGARVIYFWEGQQVLCTTKEECTTTPGWSHEPTSPFAFGPPMPMGTRAGEGKVVEPLCMAPSRPLTNSSSPSDLVIMLRQYSIYLDQYMYGNVPDCYPNGYDMPSLHRLPVFHRLDAYLSLSVTQAQSKSTILDSHNEVFVRGEALTMRSDAERVNYLMLMWVLLKGNDNMWAGSNAIAFDFIHPVLVQRMIAVAQDQPECGYVLQCWDSGSCFCGNLNSDEDNACEDATKMDRALWDHAEGQIFSWEVRYVLLFFVWLCVKLICVFFLAVDTCGPAGCCTMFRRVDMDKVEEFLQAVGSATLVGSEKRKEKGTK